MKSIMFGASALAAVLFVSAPATAQHSSGEISKAHRDLAATLSVTASDERNLIRTLAELTAVLKTSPDAGDLELSCPGVVEAMVSSSEPVMRELMQRGAIEYQVGLAELLSGGMTAHEAESADRFFHGPLGHRFLEAAIVNGTLASSLESSLDDENGDIAPMSFQRDQYASVQRTLGSLSSEDLAELERTFSTESWGMQFASLQAPIVQLRYQITNGELLPEEDAALEEAMSSALESKLEECGFAEQE